MPSPLDQLVEIIHSGMSDPWKENNKKALAALFGTRYPKRAEPTVILRAPDMKGSDSGIPYSAFVHPSNAESGAYGGMSFVIFPGDDATCLVSMVVGTQGLAPDEAILGRPGHARKIQAVCAWLNHQFGNGSQVAWAKQDPTRIDIEVPETIQKAWSNYERPFNKYGKVMYAIYRPTDDRRGTMAALTAMLDIMFWERGHTPLKEFQDDASAIESGWFEHLMPTKSRSDATRLLKSRRYVIIQGPPGTGKTRMAREIRKLDYANNGDTVQFHPNTTYENFVGGLAPLQESNNGETSIGFRFAPKPGFLMEAAAKAKANPTQNYLLHIDEINRADLAKVLGESIYLFEPDPEYPREVDLAYDFGQPFFRKLKLPDNLHILGTMNSADRSIAILDVAVRRRFAFLSLWPSLVAVETNGCDLTVAAFKRLMSTFVEHANDDALSLVPGHSYFLHKDEELARINLKASLVPLLNEYLAQGYVSGFAEAIRADVQWLESQ